MASPRINLSNPLRCVPLEAATVASHVLPLSRSLFNFVEGKVYGRLYRAVAYLTDRSTRLVSYLLCRAINNELTRRILPSVSAMDSKIKRACTFSNKWAAKALSLPFFLTLRALTLSCATICTIIASPVFTIISSIGLTLSLCKKATLKLYKVLKNTREDLETHSGILSKTGLILGKLPYRLGACSLKHALHLILSTLYKTLSFAFVHLLAPVYTLSSLLLLSNRFNIYNYESTQGVINDFVRDMQDERSGKVYNLIGAEYCTTLVSEATKEIETLKNPAALGARSMSPSASNREPSADNARADKEEPRHVLTTTGQKLSTPTLDGKDGKEELQLPQQSIDGLQNVRVSSPVGEAQQHTH